MVVQAGPSLFSKDQNARWLKGSGRQRLCPVSGVKQRGKDRRPGEFPGKVLELGEQKLETL